MTVRVLTSNAGFTQGIQRRHACHLLSGLQRVIPTTARHLGLEPGSCCIASLLKSDFPPKILFPSCLH